MAQSVDEKVTFPADLDIPTHSAEHSSLEGKEKAELAPGLIDTVVEGVITKDGLKVHPQPTTDPLDPLNWSPWRKASILAIVMIK